MRSFAAARTNHLLLSTLGLFSAINDFSFQHGLCPCQPRCVFDKSVDKHAVDAHTTNLFQFPTPILVIPLSGDLK